MDDTSRRSKVILAANPAHFTGIEHLFWEDVALHVKDRGWRLVEIATIMSTPPNRNAVSIAIPTPLVDINRKLRHVPITADREGWAWIDEQFLRTQEDWEHRRWRLEERLPAVLQGLMRLVSFVDTAMSSIRPSIVLTTNKIDHNVALFRRAAVHQGVPASVVERSPLDSIWLEPEGLFAESRVWTDYPKVRDDLPEDVLEAGKREVEKLIENPYGFRPDARNPDTGLREMRGARRPIFFLPMDNVLWTGWEQQGHPMRSVDSPLYETPREAIADLAERAESLGGTLVVKKHPACLHVHEGMLTRNAILCDGDMGAMLDLSDVVVCFNTKVAFPALAMGKPVVTLAPNPAAASGATYHCLERSTVQATLRQASNRQGLQEKISRLSPFVGWLEERVFYHCGDIPSARGSKEFVDELMASVEEPARPVEEKEVDEAVEHLVRMAGRPPVRRVVMADARRNAPASAAAGRGPLVRREPRLKSLAREALRVVAREGPAALGRKVLRKIARLPGVAATFRSAPKTHAGKKPVLLEMDEERSKWRLEAASEDGYRYFSRLWCSESIPEHALYTTPCPGREIERLRSWQSRYAGKRIFIVGRDIGPNETLERLSGDHTFGIDGVHALFDRVAWRPTFYTTHDWNHVPEEADRISSLEGMTFFFPQRFRGLLRQGRDVYWYWLKGQAPSSSEQFSHDIASGLGEGDTATFAAIQIARYMGFDPICLVGCDTTRAVPSSVNLVREANIVDESRL